MPLFRIAAEDAEAEGLAAEAAAMAARAAADAAEGEEKEARKKRKCRRRMTWSSKMMTRTTRTMGCRASIWRKQSCLDNLRNTPRRCMKS